MSGDEYEIASDHAEVNLGPRPSVHGYEAMFATAVAHGNPMHVMPRKGREAWGVSVDCFTYYGETLWDAMCKAMAGPDLAEGRQR